MPVNSGVPLLPAQFLDQGWDKKGVVGEILKEI
ncbi:MAG: hypothetical protein HONDAALG_03855 [Gammaproteobacteria bacterium]|nr:hypothetical protein [Gammaproteobacteria bacterium]